MRADDYNKEYISTAGNTQVETGNCFLKAIIVGTTTGTALKVIDGTGGTTTNVAELKADVAEGYYEFNCQMTKGIRIVSGAGKYTVIYRKH